MSKKRQSILVSGAILAAAVWLFALAMLVSQPGASVDPAAIPTLASLPNAESNAAQPDSDAAGQPALDVDSAQSTALPVVVLNPPNQTNVDTALPVSGGDTGLPTVNVPSEPIPNTVIIRFDAGSSEEERTAYIESIGGQVTRTIGALNTVVVAVPEGVTPDMLPPAAIVVQSEPDYYISAQASPPNDPLFSGQWGLNVVRAPEAWPMISSGSPQVSIAVVDSGICASHPDLTGRIGSGWDFVQSDETPQDEYGHGCAVAGVIAANGNNNLGIAGVAPNVEIMPLRVLDGQGVGTYSRVAAAIVYATDHGAQIINLSLGGSSPSGVLQDAVNYAASHQVMVVAAAGNGGSPTAMYPAAYETVIAVGSVDADLQRSSFSNYGPQVDLYAPGSGITSTGLGGYVTMSGTSLAAPYVSGVAALEMAVGSTLTVDGGIVAFQHTLPVEPPPGDVLTCNREESRQAYLAFEDLVRQQVADPTTVTDDQIKAARSAYLDATNDCFLLAYNTRALTIDSEGQWIDSGDASAQFRAFGTKWGANSPFPMLQPPAITGGTVTFSFMPSGVSLALKEGVPSSTVEIAVSQLEPEVSDNFPEGTCDLQDEVRDAILLWSEVADINFQEVVDGGQPFNHASSIVGDIRIGSHLIDGEGNELGHAFFPGPVPDEPNATGVGDLFFDAGENWGCETVRNDAGDVLVLDIGVVTTHEIGHAIGLRHQNAPPGAVMNPTYNEAISSLAADDIDGARAIYGVDTLESPPLLPVTLNGNIATFNWTEVAGGSASQYQIQVALASDPDFTTPVIDTTVPAPPFTANAPLDNNTYLWRVRGYLDGYGPFSNPNSPNATFTVAFGVPNLVSPLNGEIVSSGTVTFQWGSAGASSDTFVLQVATGTQFDSTDLLQNLSNLSGLSRAVSGFPDGVYYWRVSKTGGDFSLPFQFSVDSNVPDLTFPPNDALLSDGDVNFTWLPVPGATEYQIQIDTSPNFAGLLFLDKLFLDKLFLDKLFLDKLFLDKLFLDKLFLDKLFLDKLFLDKLFLDKLFLDKLFLDKLFLDKLFLDKLFLDKLFLDKLFLDKLTEPAASFEKPLSEGLHYWRVRARRADGEWGGWSETFSFRIETRPNLVVNEIKVSDPSYIEIYNAGTSAENLTGWEVVIYEPDSATPAFTFTFPSNCMGGESGCTLAAGDYLVLHETAGANDAENIYLGANTMNWPLPGEAEGGSLSATSLPMIDGVISDTPQTQPETAAALSGQVLPDTVTAQSIITVNTTDMTVEDDGQCSLPEAIIAANTDAPSGELDGECASGEDADTITLAATEYVLDAVFDTTDGLNGLPSITSDITISGSGGTIIRRASEGLFRIFHVAAGGKLNLQSVTVKDGQAQFGASAYNNAEFLPNGSALLGSGNDRLLHLWDADANRGTHEPLRQFSGHEGDVTSVDVSPDGEIAATSSADGTVKLWDINTGALIDTFAGHEGDVTKVAFSGNGQFVASASTDETALLWDVNDGVVAQEFGPVGNSVIGVDVNADGSRVLTGDGNGDVILWNADNGELQSVLSGHLFPITDVEYSPDYTRAVSSDVFGTINVWNVDEGDSGFGDIITTFTGHSGLVSHVSFSPDGAWIASSGSDGVLIWEAETGDILDSFSFSTTANGVSFHPSLSEILVALNDGTVRRIVLDFESDNDFETIATGAGFNGGAIFNRGTLEIGFGSVITSNHASNEGGGIYSTSTGDVLIFASTVSENSADIGGGISVANGAIDLSGVTLDNNDASTLGGGLYVFNTLTGVFSSAMTNNNADIGGGVLFDSSEVGVINSTFSGNVATDSGGGMAVDEGSLDASFATLAANDAVNFSGGGIRIFEGSEAHFKNAIVANNTAELDDNCFGTFESVENSLTTDDTCEGFVQVTSGDLNLQPLANNGGSTPTHALVAPSVAIDGVDDCSDIDGAFNPLPDDQRGQPRPSGTACDLGAFELQTETGDTPQDNPYTVNTLTLTDDGLCGALHCSLIEAINAANADDIDSTINLGDGQTYWLTAVHNMTDGANGLPSIASTITINGSNSTINRDGDAPQFRILHMASGANLTLNNVTIGNGNLGLDMTFTIGDLGAGIYKSAAGTLTLEDSTIANNVALGGGGIYSAGGTVNIIDSTISGNQAIYGGGVSNNGGGALNIDNSFVSGNGVGDVNGEGGGVFTNSGLVTITNSTFESNQSALGGGLFIHVGGSASLSDSAFTGNDALTHGGGMAVRGSATINNSTFAQNVAAFNGGAIDVMDGTAVVTITNSLIESNTSNSTGGGTGGGGIANFGTLNLITSTIRSNTSDTDGGGLFNSGTAIVSRSTISGNEAQYGAGLYNNVATNIVNSTISGNEASQFGAGVQNWGDFFAVNVTVANNTAVLRGSGIHYSGGSIDFKNSIMANNGDNCAVFEGFSGTITFGGSGSNLANDDNCGFGFGFASNSSLALGGLGNNGGPTQTHALLPGSAAIDGVENCTSDGETFLSVDQRGASRPQGEACDIGAFEFGGEVPVFGTIGGAVALIPPSSGEIEILAEGDAVPDFVRFGDTNIPAPAGTDFTGGTIDLPPDNLNIGRDPASSDSDHRTDFFAQKPSRGGQNAVKVVINEIFPGTVDAIELYNPSVETVRLGGWEVWVFNQDGKVDTAFTFPAGFELLPNRYLVLHETAGVNTEADVFMNDDISWPSTNPAGAVLLTNGVSEMDFVVFGNEAVNELSLAGIAENLQDTGWTGPSPLPPLANEALGRDSVSTDTDAGADWYQQLPSLGSVNPMVRPLPNDNFSDAIEILSVPYRDITNTSGAEMSSVGEPEPSCGFNVGFQVWYKYTPPLSTTLRLQTDGSKIDTVLSVWTDATTQVACDDDSSPDDTRSRLDLSLAAGTTYFIGVGGKNNTPGQVVLSLLPPANDDFDEAIVVGGLPFSSSQNTIAASSPLDDPAASCGSLDGRSVWYRFTAVTDDAVRFHTEGSNYNTILSVWTGARGSLAQIACNDNTGETALSSIALQPVIGQTYYIMAGGPSDAGGQLIFNATLLIPPPNDDFVNSINVEDLDSNPYDENTLGATEEDLDPNPSCGINTSKTVWFTYEAESSQTIAFQTFGSNFDTVMSIWSADLSTELGCNDDAGAGRQSYLEFSGAPGETYYILVSGHQGEGGDLIFEAFLLGTPPANDEPDGAFTVDPLPYSFDQPESEIIKATVSVNEPTPSCGVAVGKTVWYEFTPDADGTFSIETLGSDYDTVLAVYADLGGTLAEVACDDDGILDGSSRLLLNATNSTSYLILVGGWNGESGNLHLEVEAVDTSPAFDDQATPKIIPNVPYGDSDSTVFATDAPDDPLPTCGVSVGKTVWYQYTPSSNALLLFDTNGSSFDTNLSIYHITPGGLGEVACDDDGGEGLASFVEFAPDAGQTYLIMIGGTSGSSGHLSLHVEAVEPPPNDDIENATDLSDVFVLDLLDVRGATSAGDDPAHSCNANTGRTVWYTVTPTQNGTMSFNTLGSNYNTVMSVYELESDDSLTEIACDDNSGDNLTSRIDNLPSTPNQTYYVMISGAFGQTGNLNFNVALLTPPANDDIEGAFAISGTVFDYTQETTNASNAADDPLSCGLLASKTVWYDYVATGDDLLRIDVSGSDFNTIAAAYTGDRGSLTQVGCEFFGTLDVITEPGETYHILIGGFGGESGNLDLHAEVVDIPDNDPVDGAFEIPALPYSNTQSSGGATRVDEPPVTCDFTVGKTVWYRYSASGSEGLLHFDSVGSDFSTVMAVYQETDGGLVQVGCNTFGAVEVPAEAGDYLIMIGGWRGKSGQLVINASSIPQPDNDEFENATEVGQLPFTDDENTDGASSDSGDPLTCDPESGKTVWYVFHSFGDGTLHISTDGSLFNTVIAVYTNPGPPTAQVNFGPLLELDLLACAKGSQLDVPVEGGQTYYIMISGEDSDSGPLHIEITGDIIPTPPHLTVEKIANPGELSEPGGEVLFTVHIRNASIFGTVTINSIVDDAYGNVCAALLPAILNAGDTLTCTFAQFVAGQPGENHDNTLHVTGIHENGAPVEGSASATVTIINLPSSIKVTKKANPVTLSEPGGLVEFTVEVENTSAADNVTLTSLVDSLFGDMSAQCGLPAAITPGQTFTCAFTGNVSGVSGDTHVNTIEASGTDDDGQPVSDIGSAVVSITCANPDPERDLRGSLPSRTRGVVINASPDCYYVVGLASYERPDNNIDNQRLFDYSTAVIGPKQTVNLFVDVPTCALQVDLFYGEVLLSLNGVRYGERKLANRLSNNLPFCDFSQDQLNLAAVPEDGTTNVHLQWDDPLLVEAAYHLERSDDGATFSEIAVLPPNSTNYLDSGLCYTHYWYRVRGAYGAGGPFTAYSSVAEVTTSCPALAAPSDLSAAAVSESQIDLTWTDNSSDETSFHVERSADGVTWTEIASLPTDSTAYQDIGLTCATPYQYRVRAFRSLDAQFSAYSSIAGDSSEACPPPPLAAPTNLTATGVSESQIDLTWTDNSGDETAFNIERSADGITWSPLASVPADTTAYQDTGLACGITQHYRVLAFRGGDSQTSDPSNEVGASTFVCQLSVAVTTNTVGQYQDGVWQFRDMADESAPVTSITYGESGWLPLIGDWDGDGSDGLGLYQDGQWTLRSASGVGLSDTVFAFGPAESGWLPIVGDWNGDGVDTAGLYKGGMWLLRNSNTTGDWEMNFVFGQNLPDALPLAGDWNGDGLDTVGLYLNGQWYLLDALVTTDSVAPIAFGPTEGGWLPVAGDWNGDGADTIGLVKDGLWRLRNSNGDGPTDLGFSFGVGASGWRPLGSFNGDLSLLAAGLTIAATPVPTDEVAATESPDVTQAVTPESTETPTAEVTESDSAPSKTPTEAEAVVTGETVTDEPTTQAPPSESPTTEAPPPTTESPPPTDPSPEISPEAG